MIVRCPCGQKGFQDKFLIDRFTRAQTALGTKLRNGKFGRGQRRSPHFQIRRVFPGFLYHPMTSRQLMALGASEPGCKAGLP